MKYLFTNKEVKVGDICLVLCNENQFNSFHFERRFSSIRFFVSDEINRFGIRVIKTFENKCIGYLIYEKKSNKKICPYIQNKKFMYVSISRNNSVGLIKYKSR